MKLERSRRESVCAPVLCSSYARKIVSGSSASLLPGRHLILLDQIVPRALWLIEPTVKTLSISSSISPSHRAWVICPDGGLGFPLPIEEVSPCLMISSG